MFKFNTFNLKFLLNKYNSTIRKFTKFLFFFKLSRVRKFKSLKALKKHNKFFWKKKWKIEKPYKKWLYVWSHINKLYNLDKVKHLNRILVKTKILVNKYVFFSKITIQDFRIWKKYLTLNLHNKFFFLFEGNNFFNYLSVKTKMKKKIKKQGKSFGFSLWKKTNIRLKRKHAKLVKKGNLLNYLSSSLVVPDEVNNDAGTEELYIEDLFDVYTFYFSKIKSKRITKSKKKHKVKLLRRRNKKRKKKSFLRGKRITTKPTEKYFLTEYNYCYRSFDFLTILLPFFNAKYSFNTITDRLLKWRIRF